jgi:hypothetical protein
MGFKRLSKLVIDGYRLLRHGAIVPPCELRRSTTQENGWIEPNGVVCS